MGMTRSLSRAPSERQRQAAALLPAVAARLRPAVLEGLGSMLFPARPGSPGFGTDARRRDTAPAAASKLSASRYVNY